MSTIGESLQEKFGESLILSPNLVMKPITE